MKAKEYKDWVNSLPDDAEILVLQGAHHSFPLTNPVFIAIEGSSITQPVPGMLSGKTISSFPKIEGEDNVDPR